jgi:uncharacterized protein YciI
MTGTYAVIARDTPGAEAARTAARADHFAHIETILDRVLIAGPLKDEDGAFTGSLVVIRADSEADARALFESDPYFKAGVWQDAEIRAFTAAAGDWIGGKIW